jgi:hypothetical protein
MPASRPRHGTHASVEPDRGRPSTRRHTLGEPTRRRQAVREPPRPTTYRTLRFLSPADRPFTYKSAVHRRLPVADKLEIVIADDLVEKVTNTLLDSCQTGRIVEGKIFVLPVDEALRIRTGERGDAAVSSS